MRLIVLSKTHAWGRFADDRYEAVDYAHTCALNIVFADNDVFSGPSSKPQGGPDKPFNSRCHLTNAGLARRWKLVFSAIARNFVVEPDGIEPTTSCLQSTRSTN
jgi:hypothetical protein